MVALELEAVLPQRPAGGAFLPEALQQSRQVAGGGVEAGDDRVPLPPPLLPPDAYRLIPWQNYLPAGTPRTMAIDHGLAAVRARDGALKGSSVEEAGHGEA